MRHTSLPPFTFYFSLFSPFSTFTQVNCCCSNIKTWNALGSAHNVLFALHFPRQNMAGEGPWCMGGDILSLLGLQYSGISVFLL